MQPILRLSRYETGKLRLSADMAVRFARALEITTGDLPQPKKTGKQQALKPSRKVLWRLEQIETLPAHHQHTVLSSGG